MKNRKRITAVFLAAWIAFGAVFVYHVPVPELSMTTKAKEPTKEETVRVKADASGSVTKVTVESVLRGITGSSPIRDVSLLSDIRNRSGDEEFTEENGNIIVWDNHGEDIRYEGEAGADKLPFSVKVTYYLNGRRMSAEEIAGKSGRIRIRFDYTNKTSYVPFLFLSAVMLDGDLIKNAEVENGYVSELGDTFVAVGYAMPGLADALKFKSYEATEDVDIPEYVEITGDVTDFKLSFTATIVTNGMFADLDLKELDDADELTENLDELKDAIKKMGSGMDALANGASEYRNALSAYVDGVVQVDEGMDGLRGGLAQMNNNKDKLSDGAGMLAGGLTNLHEQLKKTDLAGMLSGASSQMAAQAEGLTNTFAAMGEGLKEMAAAEAALDGMLNEAYASVESLEGEEGDAARAKIGAAMEASKGLSAAIAGNGEALSAVQEGLSAALYEGAAEGGGAQEMTTQVTELVNGIGKLADGSRQLYEGVKTYCDGIGEVTHGSYLISEGTQTLADNGAQLLAAYDQLSDGIRKARDGVKKFDEEAVDKISELAGDDLKQVLDALREVQKADEAYGNFAGVSDGFKGSVRFILETEGIE